MIWDLFLRMLYGNYFDKNFGFHYILMFMLLLALNRSKFQILPLSVPL
jgi:hypothetical protein